MNDDPQIKWAKRAIECEPAFLSVQKELSDEESVVCNSIVPIPFSERILFDQRALHAPRMEHYSRLI